MIDTLKSYIIYCDVAPCTRSLHIQSVVDEMNAELEAIRQGWNKFGVNNHVCPKCFKLTRIISRLNDESFGQIIIRVHFDKSA